MKMIACFLTLAAVSCGAFAVQPTEDSIDTLLTATKAERMADDVMSNMDGYIRQSMEAASRGQAHTPQQRRVLDALPARLAEIVKQEVSWEKMRPMYMTIYQESFSQEEIDGLISFYKSPVGVAYVDKMPVVMHKTISLMQSRMVPMMEKVRELTRRAIEEAKAAK